MNVWKARKLVSLIATRDLDLENRLRCIHALDDIIAAERARIIAALMRRRGGEGKTPPDGGSPTGRGPWARLESHR